MIISAKGVEGLHAVAKGWEWQGPFEIEYINIERRDYETIVVVVRGGKSCWVRLDQCVTGDEIEMRWHCERVLLNKATKSLSFQKVI